MLKFFRLPFATAGDKTAIPDPVDTNGNVSYSQGYGFDYQRQKTDPASKNIERDKMNQLFFDVTTAIAELQSQGIPDFITAALNGGTAYSYAINALVRWTDGDVYISLAAANTADPTDLTKWALVPTPARVQAAYNISAVAAGTADALTGAFSPAIAALPAAPGTLSVLVRAGAANTTTTPTFSPNGLTAKTIVKGANTPLNVGDIAGAGHWLDLQYDATLDKWVLQNPANAARQPAAFDAYANAATSLADGVFTKVNFATETLDTDNLFAASRFTADRAGVYHFDASVGLSTVSGTLTTAFYLNGALHKRGTGVQVTATGAQSAASANIVMAVGDYVEVYAFQSTGGAKNTIAAQGNTYFNGNFVRPV